MRNEEVVDNWGRSIKAKSSNGQLSTNGSILYSYRQPIGITTADGSKVVLDYTAPAGAFISQTTSTHVGIAHSVADQVMNPIAAKLGGLFPDR